MKVPGKCVHFNGTINSTCDAGVKYDDVIDKSSTPYSLPCIEKYNATNVKCEKRQLPTTEEVEIDEKKFRKQMEGVGMARSAITAHLGGPWKKGMSSAQGRITCPVCQLTDGLGFSRAGCNGHVHARCETPNCVSWME